ncbi:protein TPX2-like isoform X2 [Trifolium pratense]|uniref:protein TPX2-like isoform X2 n=1 Tax=Trifolium pratense TaxID=57577 RepID=UPI001E694C28|nr:protein TPX2-like isoform X2 [Trifolium pratense]
MTTTTTMTTMEEEEEENDDAEIQHVFVAHEIDLDYEFDAARFFDFTRPESSFESHQAQLWFQTAPNYPPSPFVTKLAVREEFELDVDRSTKLKNVECAMSNIDDDKEEAGPTTVSSAMEISDIVDGHTYGSKPIGNSLNSNFKPDVPKGSTLMKPTATQLSRQNRPAKNVGSRFRKQLAQKEMNLSTSSGVESQAAKRQKLEGGHLCKVTDTKQQTNFVHKKPMRAVTVEQNSACSKLKLTIPREPDLKTAHRAQRIRPKIVGEAEHMTVAAPRFKARPLNRRILEAPSLPLPKRSTPHLPEFREFHLKTTERAMQHTSATSSSHHSNDSDKGWDKHTSVSALEHKIKDARRPAAMGAPKHDGLGFTHIFKAQPLNKKILSSKEHAGALHTNKETTVPMEFDLHAEKGIQHNPPIELFSKLSLTSEAQPNNGSHFKLPQQSRMCRKEKPFTFGAKQIHHGNGGCHSLLSARRSLGIR